LTKSAVEPLPEVVVDLAEKGLIRVLHVDDEGGFLKAAKQCLEMEGQFQVETASSVRPRSSYLSASTETLLPLSVFLNLLLFLDSVVWNETPSKTKQTGTKSG